MKLFIKPRSFPAVGLQQQEADEKEEEEEEEEVEVEVEEEEEKEIMGRKGGWGKKGEIWTDPPIYRPSVNEWIKINVEKNKEAKTVDSSSSSSSSEPLVFGVNWAPTEQPLADDDILMRVIKDNQIDLTTTTTTNDNDNEDDEEFVEAVMKPTLLTPKPDFDPILASEYPSMITELLENAMSD